MLSMSDVTDNWLGKARRMPVSMLNSTYLSPNKVQDMQKKIVTQEMQIWQN